MLYEALPRLAFVGARSTPGFIEFQTRLTITNSPAPKPSPTTRLKLRLNGSDELGSRHLLTVLKNGPHCMHAEPSHLPVEGSTWLPECHDEGTKRFPVEAEYGSGLYRVDAKAKVKTAPAHIEGDFNGGVEAYDGSFLTHSLRASSENRRADGNMTKRAETRCWEAGIHNPVKRSRAAVNDGTAHDRTRLKLFGQRR